MHGKKRRVKPPQVLSGKEEETDVAAQHNSAANDEFGINASYFQDLDGDSQHDLARDIVANVDGLGATRGQEPVTQVLYQ